MAAVKKTTKQNGFGEKQTVRVITVDKKKRRVECAMRDGAMIWVAVWETGTVFRWPEVGEIWTVRMDTGIWRLDQIVQSTLAEDESEATPKTLEELSEGDTRIIGAKVHIANAVIGSDNIHVNFEAAYNVSKGSDISDKLVQACEDLAGTGLTLLIPNGVWKLTRPIQVKGFKLQGVGLYDVSNITDYGSVLSLEGALETTASHVITVTGGGWVSGLVFWYPKEKITNTTPAITATGYVVRLDDLDPRHNARCFDNYFVNPPYGISTHQGWSKVYDNKLSCTKVCIQDEEQFAEHSFARNEITVGNWTGLYGSQLGAYIGSNAIAFKLTQTLASFTDNTVFGYQEGYRFEGYSQFVHVNGGLVDGTQYCVRFVPGHGPTDVVFTGVTFGSLLAGNIGASRDNKATFESNCVNVGTPINRANIVFNNCMAQGANGDLILVSSAGAFANSVSINGGFWNSPGRFLHTYEMLVSSVVGTFTESLLANDGDKITGGTSGATAIVRRYSAGKLYLDSVVGVFLGGETITGSKSGTTAKVTSIAQTQRYVVVRFSDTSPGNLSMSNVHCDLTAFLWAGGIWFLNGQTLQVNNCAFFSTLETTNNCIRVDTCNRFVEIANVSEIPGAVNVDSLVVGPLANAAVSGPSSWDRP